MSFCLQTKFFCRFDADTSQKRGRIVCISHIKQMAQRVYSNIEHPIYCNQFAVMCTIRKSFKIRFISCDYRMNILDFDLNVNFDVYRIFCILLFRYANFYLHAQCNDFSQIHCLIITLSDNQLYIHPLIFYDVIQRQKKLCLWVCWWDLKRAPISIQHHNCR